MEIVLVDTETDGLRHEYTKLHCAAVQKEDDPEPTLLVGAKELEDWAEKNTSKSTVWVGHNMCGFDYWAINELTGVVIQENQVLDTSVLTKLVDYEKYNTHSLDGIASSLGCPKTEYTGGWETYTPTMGSYCVDDVRSLKVIWDKYKFAVDKYRDAVFVETDMSLICAEMQANGFPFNRTKAESLLSDVEHKMQVLEDDMRKEWPKTLVVDRRIQYRKTKDGKLYANVEKAMSAAPKWEVDGDELVLYKWLEFNPGSPKQRIAKLWDAGWKPYDKTKGHVQYERGLRSYGRR